MRTGTIAFIAASLAVSQAAGQAVSQETFGARFDAGHCLKVTQRSVGGTPAHMEFESRDGTPIFEFVINAGNQTYYVACDAMTGALSAVDVIVQANDPRWRDAKVDEARAREVATLVLAGVQPADEEVDEARAREVATRRYPGKVEDVKRLLLSEGGMAYEIDVQAQGGQGEFNVYVDAVSGQITTVNIEYWEKPGPQISEAIEGAAPAAEGGLQPGR